MLSKPWLMLPPQVAHDLSPLFLRLLGAATSIKTPVVRSQSWRGLVFKNPLGIAGGVDKNGEFVDVWRALGCGFVEVGTVTPLPQEPNEGKIIDRDLKTFSLWNKMGFPSDGMHEVLSNLKAQQSHTTPLFINLGKNRTTPNEKAAEDYLMLIKHFTEIADVFVINISSPNTKGLRQLQNQDALAELLKPLVAEAASSHKPLLVKLSPDMAEQDLASSLQVAAQVGVDGFVLTNTTLSRTSGMNFPAEGGVSGLALKELAEKNLVLALQHLGSLRKNKLIVSVGGLSTADDLQRRLDLGADLAQLYTSLIFEGPFVIRRILQQLTESQA